MTRGRDAIRELLSGNIKPQAEPTTPMPQKRSAGAVRAMSVELQQLSEDAAAAKELKQKLAESEIVVEIDPAAVDASPVMDRIATENDQAFQALKAAIADKGQQVPVMVRPRPGHSGRFQIAYGRRRLKAAAELGRPVKAVVRELSDRELVIAQAQENGSRTDLTFIERALFAANLIVHGFDKDTIATALNVDKPELSRLLGVAHTVTPALIEAIGPAPKVGRPRWLLLSAKLSDPLVVARAAELRHVDEFKKADSNGRFNLVLAAVSDPSPAKEEKLALRLDDGQRVAWLERSAKGVRLTTEDLSFSTFLEAQLPKLLREFGSQDTDVQSGNAKSESES